MSTALPRVSDLRHVIDELEGHPDHRRLVGAALLAQRAQSCIADLALAQTCCESLAQLASAPVPHVTKLHMMSAQHALIATAIVLYARATSTNSRGGERGSVSVEDRLAPDDLAEHRMLVALRNRSIAHVHAEEEVGGSIWHREQMILRNEGEAWLPGCATRRVQIEEETVIRLRRLIPIASALIRATFLKHLTKLTEMMNEAMIPASLIEKHEFDPVEFFGSVEAARHALRPPPGRSAVGMSR